MALGGVALTVAYDKGRKANGVFVVVALLGAVGCAAMARRAWHEEPGAAFILSAATLLWLSVAGMVWLSITDPIRLVSGRFDHETRSFVLTAADGSVSALPYCELHSFAVRRKVSTGKHKTVSYVVYLLKRDGGFWDLQAFGDPGLANEMLAELRGSVSLADTSSNGEGGPATLPDAISREDVGGVIRFTWRNQERVVDSLCGVLFGASIIALPFGMVGVMTGAPTFFELLAALAVAWFASHQLKARGRIFQLEIGGRFLTYSTREGRDPLFRVRRVLTIDQVTRLQSVYELARSHQERSHQLTFVSEQHAPRLHARRLADRDAESTREAIALDQSIIELDLPGIRTADVLKLEAYLQHELARRGQNVA